MRLAQSTVLVLGSRPRPMLFLPLEPASPDAAQRVKAKSSEGALAQ